MQSRLPIEGEGMTIEAVCRMSVDEATEELKHYGRMVEFGNEFVGGYMNPAEPHKSEGRAVTALMDLADAFQRCRELADYLHEESRSWWYWRQLVREYHEVVKIWR